VGSEDRNFLGKLGDVTNTGYAVMAILGVILVLFLLNYLWKLKENPLRLLLKLAAMVGAVYLARALVLQVSDGRLQEWELPLEVALTIGAVGLLTLLFLRSINMAGVFFRVVTIVGLLMITWLLIRNYSDRNLVSEDGLPGAVGVTLFFVILGVTLQYSIGLGLAMLVTQNLPGKRFFRVVFLLPMMIAPVGIGFLFRMMTDTILGPFSPLWEAIGLQDFSWVNDPLGARLAVTIGDVWQWTPFMFIILLAAVEGTSQETVEAALVDGANRWQVFWHIIVPQIIPVSTTLILIRMIEAFKMVDMPQILTRGGPGTATETLTLRAYNLWRAIDLGTSAAIAYMLLILVTFVALVYVNFVRRRLLERV
jgi:multiple sugar transport system permease protein